MRARAGLFLIAALTVLIVALSTGSAVYYTVFAAMACMFALSLISVLVALFTVKIEVGCANRRIERCGKAIVTVHARHMSPLPVKLLSIELNSPERANSTHALELVAPPIRGKTYEYSFTCPHRGIFRVGVGRVSVTDLFDLFTLRRRMKDRTTELLVMPRVQEIPAVDLRSGDMGTDSLTRMTEDNASPTDVREWLAGDPLKKIHWKLTMRKRELLVRTYEESAKPDTLILADLSPTEALEALALSIEDAICEIAAAVATAQLRASYPVHMPLQCTAPVEVMGQSFAESARFVDALARARFDSTHSYDQVLGLEFRRMQRTGGVVLITSRLSARIADAAVQMRRSGMQVLFYFVTDAARAETDELISRMMLSGAVVKKVNPWNETPLKDI